MKTCTKCGETKLLSEFARRSDRPSGVTASCKECRRQATSAWRAKNPERVSQYRADHADEIAAYVRDWQTRNRHKVNAASLAWYHRNKGRVAAYRREHAEEIREYQRRWYEENGDLAANKRARRRAAVARMPMEEVSRTYIIERDGAKCHFCGRRCKEKDIHIDHLVPVSWDGAEHSAKNLRVACAACNLKSGPGRLPAQLLIFG